MIYVRFFFKAPATTEIYTYGHTLSQHDALPLWPRLRGWIEESRDDLRMRQRIARAAAEWQASERDTDLLYRGTPLLTAQEWLARNPDLVGDLESSFLAASAADKAAREALAAERQRRAVRTRRLAIAPTT